MKTIREYILIIAVFLFSILLNSCNQTFVVEDSAQIESETISCRPNESYYECVPNCTGNGPCVPGCYCSPGTIRNNRGFCECFDPAISSYLNQYISGTFIPPDVGGINNHKYSTTVFSGNSVRIVVKAASSDEVTINVESSSFFTGYTNSSENNKIDRVYHHSNIVEPNCFPLKYQITVSVIRAEGSSFIPYVEFYTSL